MNRILRSLRALVAMLVVVALAAYLVTIQGLQQAEPFYERAIGADPRAMAAAAAKIEARVADLAEHPRAEPEWHAEFAADEVNGWIASRLENPRAAWLPASISDIRIAIPERGCLVGFRVASSQLTAIIAADADATLTAPNRVKVELRSIKAGRFPLPLATVKEHCAKLLADAGLTAIWSDNNDPGEKLTVDIDLAPLLGRVIPLAEVTRVELASGLLKLAGDRRQPGQVATNPEPPRLLE